MDTLTHALSGMLLARATARKPSSAHTKSGLPLRVRLTAGFLAAAFPDSDFIIRLLDGPVSYLKYHRGATHSILLLPVWAWLLALLFMLLWRGKYHWKAFYSVCALGLGIHIAGDVITSFGTMLLAPFSHMKFAIPSTFILDGYVTGIILLALLLAWVWRSQSQRIALLGIVCLGGYVGVQNYFAYQARVFGAEYAQQQGLPQAKVSALPQPFSPLHWKVIVQDEDYYHISYLHLYRDQPVAAPAAQASIFERLDALYQPRQFPGWQVSRQFGDEAVTRFAQDAWQRSEFEDIREFMLFPMLSHIEQRSQGNCAWFQDHRFVLDGIRVSFQFGACRGESGNWGLYWLRDGQVLPLS